MLRSTQLPIHPDGFLDWPKFLYKASIGSCKAGEMLSRVSIAVAIRIGGAKVFDQASSDQFEAALKAAIPAHFPYSSLDAFVAELQRSGYFSYSEGQFESQRVTSSEYDAIWSRTKPVRSEQLLFDAADECASNWHPAELLRLCNNVEQDAPDYNSLEAVTAMLYFIASSPE